MIEKPTQHRCPNSGERLVCHVDDWRILGYGNMFLEPWDKKRTDDVSTESRPVSVQLWHGLRTADLDTGEQRAARVVRYLTWIRSAGAAQAAGNFVLLKEIADAARNCVGVIPGRIPKNGFPDVDKIEYPEPMSAEEIKQLLGADIRRRNLEDWLEDAESLLALKAGSE